MRKWSRAFYPILVIAAVGGIAWLVLRPREPEYKGKPLSGWLEDTDAYDPTKTQAATEAVRQIGTDAIPELRRMLRARDTPFKLKLIALVRQQHFFKVRHTSATILQLRGVRGFGALGPEGRLAVPELILMYNKNSFSDFRMAIATALGDIGPGAAEAVPSLARGTRGTDKICSLCAVDALGYIHAKPESAVPALVNCLADANGDFTGHAIDALARFGVDAGPAVPELLKFLDSPDEVLKGKARAALKEIDPETLAKAGVK
jgi:HEAT repeat protein